LGAAAFTIAFMTSRVAGWLAVLNSVLWLPACPGGGQASTDTTADTGGSTLTAGSTETTATGGPPTTGGPTCAPADCAAGEYCDEASGACVPGCDGPEDCAGAGVCDEAAHQCVDCLADADCPTGQVCEAAVCVSGCADDQPCLGDLACCDGHCADLESDVLHCGGCDACPPLANAASQCVDGSCALAACDEGFADCDGDPSNGCESAAACVCTPGAELPCYSGPVDTEGQGKCAAGVQTCAPDGLGLGACVGEVLPEAAELCGNAVDDDCDGGVDNLDEDGDGWSGCDADCCDAVGPGCVVPELINPGAFEILGNAIDDDCDAATLDDQPPPGCDGALASDSADALDYARAIDLCTFTPEDPPPGERKWGVISAAITRADGLQAAYASGTAIRGGFGPNVVPKKYQRLALLSTGNAADANDVSPPFVAFQPGLDTGLDSEAPADWLAANGGAFPASPGCPDADDTTAHDSVMLTLRVRVPTNARSFSVKMSFFSADWPEWVCTPHNDLFVALVDSQADGNPPDKNIAVHVGPDEVLHPVRVDLALVSPDAFAVCFPGEVACMGTPFNFMGCPGGTLELIGTGFFQNGDTGCGANKVTGGATGWRTMAGNVVPGEEMEVRFAIWNTGDGLFDSVAVLDDWRWSTAPAVLGLKP